MTGSSPVSNHEGDNHSNNVFGKEYPIIIHSMVEVLPRTWPGINKPGGAARVTQLYYQEEEDQEQQVRDEQSAKDINKEGTKVLTHIDVRYVVMGGREKRVPIEFCVAAPQYDTHLLANAPSEGVPTSTSSIGDPRVSILPSPFRTRFSRLRDRSALLGRCKRCGSLRSDCNSCDWVYEERERKRLQDLEQQNMNMTELKHIKENNQHSKELKRKGRKKKRINRSTMRSSRSNETALGESYVSSSEMSENSVSLSSSSSYFDASGDEGRLYHTTQTSNIFGDSTSSDDESSSLQRNPDYASSSESSSSEEDIILSELKVLNKKLTMANQLAQRLTQKPKKPARSHMRKRQKKLKPCYKRSKRLIPKQQEYIGKDKMARTIERNAQMRMNPTSETRSVIGIDAVDQDMCNDAAELGVRNFDDVRRSSHCQDASSNRAIGYVHDSDIGEKEEDDDDDDRNTSFPHDVAQRNRHILVTGDLDNVQDKPTADDAMFIQPEGDNAAFNLPSDVVDKTANVSLLDLVHFFKKTVQSMQETSIPRAERNLAAMKQKFDLARETNNKDSRQEALTALEALGW